MKPDTYKDKLNALLGITPDVVEKIEQKKAGKLGNIIGVTEEEIDERREMEGLIYFLQAPELFHARVCKHCEEPFLVSRLHVAYCSYQCIQNDMKKNWGTYWSRTADMERMVLEVYEGNEPLWLRNLPMLQRALTILNSTLETSQNLESLPADISNTETHSSTP